MEWKHMCLLMCYNPPTMGYWQSDIVVVQDFRSSYHLEAMLQKVFMGPLYLLQSTGRIRLSVLFRGRLGG